MHTSEDHVISDHRNEYFYVQKKKLSQLYMFCRTSLQIFFEHIRNYLNLADLLLKVIGNNMQTKPTSDLLILQTYKFKIEQSIDEKKNK